ncbi:AraC family transcriptional regulator [Ferrovibrio sp.]|uniref:helix-turn-helix transcriptional regulator n=1 Tax=Ferrovibrio sp. TaxID=1917215 RepID=UPI00261C0BBF|nr:AraC family transcriptional regulator [Ferrovibrio sp.]
MPVIDAPPPAKLSSRVIARGNDWSVSDFICRFGPQDRAFEERHGDVAISAVVAGSFRYRCDSGDALLHPGSFLLGNAGACYECGHDHGSGDHCIAFHFSPALFEEIAASAAGSHRFRFPAAMLPARPDLAATLVDIETLAADDSRMAAEDFALRLAETVLKATADGRSRSAAPTTGERRKIGNVLRHIEAHADQPLDLAALAGIACMSKYHFLRCFRRVVGSTPYQYLLDLRLRRAAIGLATTASPVAALAYEAGFGDLSTFNNRFRAVFGVSPGQFRRSRSNYPPTSWAKKH